jgi:hypothetical protein
MPGLQSGHQRQHCKEADHAYKNKNLEQMIWVIYRETREKRPES